MNSLKKLLERSPKTYLLILRIKRRGHWSNDWVVTPKHDLVIDGYPRSANSFAFHAFRDANKNSLKIATHTHSPAQIVQATRWKIPTMVLLRNPVDAVIGVLAFKRQLETRNGSTPQVPSEKEIRQTLNRWEWFYSNVLDVKKKVFIAEFDRVTEDFENISKEFIASIHKNWKAYDPRKTPEEKILTESFHVGPNEQRNQIKKEVKNEIQNLIQTGLFDRSLNIFEKLRFNSQKEK